MDTRTRYLNSLLGGKVDRFFRYETGAWPSTVKMWKSQGLPEYVSHEEKMNAHFYNVARAEAEKSGNEISFNEFFEHDQLVRIPVNSGYCDSPFFPKFEQYVIEESLNYQIVRDVDGVIKKNLKDNPDQSMPAFLEFPVKTRGDWEKIRDERLVKANVKDHLGDIAAIASQLNENKRTFPVLMTACGGFGHPRNLMGDENLCYMYYDEPEMMHEIMQNWADINIEIVRLVSEHISIDNYLIWEDMSYKNGPLISPAHVEEFMLPYYDQLIKFAKSHGVKSITVDTDGDCRKLLPLFNSVGVNAFMPFEVQAGMDVTQIRKDFGDNFTIIGGIDKRALAVGKDAIRKEVDRVLPYFLESGRYIPCLDHTVPVNVSYENYKYYIDYQRSYENKF